MNRPAVPHQPATDVIAPVDQALARLRVSRTRLLQHAVAAEPGAARPGTHALSRHLRALWRHWRRGLKDASTLSLVTDSVKAWWDRHPARTELTMACEVAETLVIPTVRRRPLTALATSAAAGLLLGFLLRARHPSAVSLRGAMALGLKRLARWKFSNLGLEALLGALVLAAARPAPAPPSPDSEP